MVAVVAEVIGPILDTTESDLARATESLKRMTLERDIAIEELWTTTQQRDHGTNPLTVKGTAKVIEIMANRVERGVPRRPSMPTMPPPPVGPQ